MKEVILGVLTALALGAIVRILKLPIPAPPSLLGASMVVGVTLGYMGAGALMGRFVSEKGVREPTPIEEAHKATQKPMEVRNGPRTLRVIVTKRPDKTDI